MMKLETAVHFLNQKNIFIEDSAFIKVNEVKAKCKLLKNEHGLDLVVIDYLQLYKEVREQIIDNKRYLKYLVV